MLPDLYQAADKDIIDLLISVIDSPYSNYLARQFVVAAVTKISSRHNTSPAQQSHFADILSKYTTSPELELQQRAVEFWSGCHLQSSKQLAWVLVSLTCMYYSRLPRLISIIVSENKPIGSTQNQAVCGFPFSLLLCFLSSMTRRINWVMGHRQLRPRTERTSRHQ